MKKLNFQDTISYQGSRTFYVCLSVVLMSGQSNVFRDLSEVVHSNMTLLSNVNNVAVIFFYQLCQLHIIRRSLTTDAAHSQVRALIHTQIHYCNCFLAVGLKYLHEPLPY